jgi:hypothetical protein
MMAEMGEWVSVTLNLDPANAAFAPPAQDQHRYNFLKMNNLEL